jgi:hypothetical protein
VQALGNPDAIKPRFPNINNQRTILVKACGRANSRLLASGDHLFNLIYFSLCKHPPFIFFGLNLSEIVLAISKVDFQLSKCF